MDSSLVYKEIKSILSESSDEELMIERFDQLIKKHGVEPVDEWRNLEDKSKNTVIHELVVRNCSIVIRHLVTEYGFSLKVYREADGKIPRDLVAQDNMELSNMLEELEQNQIEQPSQDDDETESDLKRKTNIVWVDLEMTSIEKPEIMECAVIITDKHLRELCHDEWVVHYDERVIESLGQWHQDQFKSVNEGGNGLFDDCLKSKNTEAQVEEQLLKIIQRYCPENECPLAGSSIHIDKDVLKQRMPKVHAYLHYRIIDVSSFRAMLRRWAPEEDQRFTRKLSEHGGDSVSHRAMDDIRYSIALMKLFRPLLTKNSSRYRNPADRAGDRKRTSEAGNAAAYQKNRTPMNFEVDETTMYADEKALKERIELEKSIKVSSLKLDGKSGPIYNRNPHLRELFIDHQNKLMQKPFKKEYRFLPGTPPPPHSLPPLSKHITTDYWGARKLVLTDIEFLTNFGRSGKFLVLYVGAAPGLHINALSGWFPTMDFVLIDSKKVETKKSDKIHIRSLEYMKDIVDEYSKFKGPILLISNVHSYGTKHELDDNMKLDIKDQINWHKKIKPVASLLTFPFPSGTRKIDFFKGNLILEPWASRSVNGCRLMVENDAALMSYNVETLKSAMNYAQRVIRTTYYEHDLKDSDSDGFDHCYDCTSEIHILQQYLEKVQSLSNKQAILEAIPKISYEVSECIHDPKRSSITNGMRTLGVIPKK